jgi:glycosyltransferase involved in cell wall biosynthesis
MILVVIPAFNEEASLGRVMSGLFAYGYTTIVVVDDGSTDRTAEVARAAGAIVLRHVINRGQGAALQTGTAYALKAGAEVVVHFDADDQFNPSDIAGAVDRVSAGQADVVLGSRFLDKRSRLPWSKHYILFPLTRLINRWFTGLALTDGQNGFRVLSKRALEKIVITHDGMAHNSEIIRQIARQKLSYEEYPVEVRYHRYGQGLRGGVRIVGELLFRFLID